MSAPEKFSRPKRMFLPDFDGREISLPAGPENWERLGQGEGKDILLLGLGPENPASLPFVQLAEKAGAKISWVESPKTLEARNRMGVSCPASWRKLDIDQALNIREPVQIFFYKPGLRIDWDFWSPALPLFELKNSRGSSLAGRKRSKAAWLPGSAAQLLHRELCLALKEAGFELVAEDVPQKPDAEFFKERFGGCLPDFALSVNFRGLDSDGRMFGLLRSLKIPVAVWLVDNPWHLLSSIKLPWWKNAPLFLTDPSFEPDLRKLGAEQVFFCPLAASQNMNRAISSSSGKSSPLFIGRSSFPDKKSFFAGAKLDPGLEAEALALLKNGNLRSGLPDYHWWQARCGKKLWPGFGAREPGLGAENCSAINRAAWLKAALPFGLRIIGDPGWHGYLPEAQILPPVDYYGSLPDLCGEAFCILNATSLLLPESLNQRHFDAWAAGGLLLTDATKGLNIFPEDLTRPIVLETPEDFGQRLEFFQSNKNYRSELIAEWRKLVLEKHQYAHRVDYMLSQSGMWQSARG